MPFQNALKLPATRPDRIVSDAPPSRDAVTISWTCFECELVNTLVNSGISTAASVPQLMIVANCHHSCPVISADTPGTRQVADEQPAHAERRGDAQDRRDPDEPRQRGFEVELLQAAVLGLGDRLVDEVADTPDMKSIRNRIAKIHTMSFACRSACSVGIASVMNEIRATPVTP